jgi:hypothetical protein
VHNDLPKAARNRVRHRCNVNAAVCTGEHWDVSEQMDTYYNPIPHFTYQMALDHSPTLKNVRILSHPLRFMTKNRADNVPAFMLW